MVIDSLFLDNFRGFPKLGVKFNKKFNIIVGDNMSGKTSVLEGLSIGIGSFLLGIDNIATRHIQKEDIRLHSFGNNTEYQLPVVVKCVGILEKKIDWSRQLNKISGRTTYSDAKNIKAIAANLQKRVRSGENVTLPLIAYFPVDSVWKGGEVGKMDLFELRSRFRGYDNALNATYNYNNFALWLKTIELSNLQKGSFTEEIKIINLAVSNCIDTCKRIFFDIELREVVMELEEGTIVPFSRLSSGFKKMTAIITDLAFRCIVLNPHLKDEVLSKINGVVLIDEIDAHLHPSWQRKIVGNLKKTFPNVQFVVTTHSPHVVASAEAGEVSSLSDMFDFIDGMSVLHPFKKSFQGWQLEYILKDILDSPVNSNELELTPLLERLDEAHKNGNTKEYEEALEEMKIILHPNDPILKV